MKKLFSVLMVLTLMCTLAFAQKNTTKPSDQATPAAKQTTNGPAISFETETVDYGVIQQHAEPFRVFKFTNTGNEALVITSATGSCGCTVPTWPQEPILPGKAGEIKVRYATDRIGKFQKTVTLQTNAADNPQKILTIKGEVLKKEEPAGVPKENNTFNNNNN